MEVTYQKLYLNWKYVWHRNSMILLQVYQDYISGATFTNIV